MTYLEYHLIFNVPLLGILLYLARNRWTPARAKWLGLLVLVVVGFTYPWDSAAVARGIWFFGEGRVALWIGNLPLEEVLFFVFETIAVVLTVFLFLSKPGSQSAATDGEGS